MRYPARMTDKTFMAEEQKEQVLEALLEKPVRHAAARKVKVSPLKLQKEMDADDDFATAVYQAEQVGLGAAESAAWDRAVEGVKSYVLHAGRPQYVINEEGESVPLVERKYSDKLLELILKSRMADTYGDKAKLEVTGAQVLIAPTNTNLDSFRDMLKAHKDNINGETDDEETEGEDLI